MSEYKKYYEEPEPCNVVNEVISLSAKFQDLHPNEARSKDLLIFDKEGKLVNQTIEIKNSHAEYIGEGMKLHGYNYEIKTTKSWDGS